MPSLKREDLSAFMEMYKARLLELKRRITETVKEGEVGLIDKAEAAHVLDDIEREVDGILECGRILCDLIKQGSYDV